MTVIAVVILIIVAGAVFAAVTGPVLFEGNRSDRLLLVAAVCLVFIFVGVFS